MKEHIAIIGAGNGGQAFAGYFSLMGEKIKIFDVVPATVDKLNEIGGVLIEGNSSIRALAKSNWQAAAWKRLSTGQS